MQIRTSVEVSEPNGKTETKKQDLHGPVNASESIRIFYESGTKCPLRQLNRKRATQSLKKPQTRNGTDITTQPRKTHWRLSPVPPNERSKGFVLKQRDEICLSRDINIVPPV